jgi:hypothetical protein
MRKTFIETAEFSDWVKMYLTDDDLAAMPRERLADPERGDVMTGCGGLRKLRIADPRRGKGKRGGARSFTCTSRSGTRSISLPCMARIRRTTSRPRTRSSTVNSSRP